MWHGRCRFDCNEGHFGWMFGDDLRSLSSSASISHIPPFIHSHAFLLGWIYLTSLRPQKQYINSNCLVNQTGKYMAFFSNAR